jgi:hypothetical protein
VKKKKQIMYLKLFKSVNILILRNQQTQLFNPSWKAFQTTSWNNQLSKDHQAETSKNRVYYGMIEGAVKNLDLNLISSCFTGSLTPNIRSVKVFSLSTSIAGVMAQPILYEQAAKLGSSVRKSCDLSLDKIVNIYFLDSSHRRRVWFCRIFHIRHPISPSRRNKKIRDRIGLQSTYR